MRTRRKIRYEDLGLDTKTGNSGYRALNKDGTFNVRKHNVPFMERINMFHSLVTMSWPSFFTILATVYFVINLFFASLYVIIGTEHLTGIRGTTTLEKFMDSFFFSAQTITTLGYGQVAPLNLPTNIVAATESLMGLLLFALATGLMYGRFSKPYASIKYSTFGLIAPYLDINGFMFRVVNPKNNQLIEVEASVTLSMQRKDNPEAREFHLLELERSKVILFPTMWTIVHPIGENSPLLGVSAEDMMKRDAEFLVFIKAFDESFSQTVYSKSSYKADEIKWGEKFTYLTKRNGTGVSIDVGGIDQTYKVDLN
ncbi:ion channel [Flagellimonas iocasae]|uniref:Ion channel n=1 Tax=Flagellimonas iocasae TaxID=2055905 RepID=A0ABW4XU59_9FLAO